LIQGKVLIDGDIVAYRAAFSTQNDFPKDAIAKCDELMEYILGKTLIFANPDEYEVFLTGGGNFRFDIAKSAPYKGNRKGEKPIHLPTVREHMVSQWGAIVSDGEEADDLIGIAATKYGPDTVVASIDKDMLQIPCRHYNFTRDEWTEVSELEGTKFFYKQILTGDSADNIVGLHGIGPKKASVLIDTLATEEDMWDCVVKMYNGDVDRVVENARLLWLRRKEGELWQPPVQ
jgi:5'-3' exonuclease